MTELHRKDIAVIIPARDEADRIGACLTALSGQMPDRVAVVLVVNNTTDTTSDTARAVAARSGIDLDILDCTLPPDQGVGLARRIGCERALHAMPHLRYLLTTDADCIVADDWVAGNIAHLGSADAVCGKIAPLPSEAGILDGMDRILCTHEGRYKTLVQELYARYAEGCADIIGTHGEAAGASLAFRKGAYLSVGGFEPVRCGEDRQILRALRQAGHDTRYVDDVFVHASCRLQGRAAGGMSDALHARLSGSDYLIDDGLAGAQWLVRQADRGTLGPWPPLVPPSERVHVRDLPRNIDRLQTFLSLPQDAQSSPAHDRPAGTAPMSRRARVASDGIGRSGARKGSAACVTAPEPGFDLRDLAT